MPFFAAICRSLCLAILCGLVPSCTTTDRPEDYGVASDAAGYVPAKIAIAPCRAWPNGARYEGQPLTSLRDADVAALCQRVDAFIEKGFNNQPYMRGYSTRRVAKMLTQAGMPNRLSDIDRLWSRTPETTCDQCDSAPSAYRGMIRERTKWVAWLTETATKLEYADAILLPFVTYAFERQFVDRGLRAAERGLGVALLLVDTNTGELLWAGGRNAVIPARRLEAANVAGQVAPPDWTRVEERVFTDDLWRDFPGRQTY